MQPCDERLSRPSWTGAVLTAAAGVCLAAGAVSLIDAADGWQDTLNAAGLTQGLSGSICSAPLVVSGWGDGAVSLLTVVGLGLIAVTAWITTRRPRLGTWAAASSLASIVPIGLLWMDAILVGRSPSRDCDGAGLSGAASASVNRAGWLFLGATLFCFLASARDRARQSDLDTSFSRPRESRLPLHPWQ